MVLEIAQYTVQPAQAEAFRTAMLTGGMPIIRRAEGCLHSDHRVGDAGASYRDVSRRPKLRRVPQQNRRPV